MSNEIKTTAESHEGKSALTQARYMFWEFITSVKLTIFLLVGIAVMIIAGTYMETTRGNQAAVAIIYRSFFMDSLIALLGINQVTCTIKRYPYKPHQVGWLMTHVGVLVIIIGSIYGRRGSLDGQLVLPEGGSATTFVIEQKEPGGMKRYEVPFGFEVSLLDFDMKTYPSTTMASDYDSHINLIDAEKGIDRKQHVKVNYPLKHRGFVIAQQSFFVAGEQTHSVFSVLYNPGTPAVFTGFVILSVGIALIVFVKPYLVKRYPPGRRRKRRKVSPATA